MMEAVMPKRLATSFALLAASFVILCIAAFAQDDSPAPSTQSTPELPAWITVETVQAAIDIHMTDDQQHQFIDAVGDFVNDHFRMIQKEVKKEAPDLERRVVSRDNALVRQLDTRMHTILTTEQWPAYENYKKVLRAQLKGMPLPQGSGRTRTPPGIGGGMG
jgi:hypothetical protein